MARLEAETTPVRSNQWSGTDTCIRVTALVQQGVVIDSLRSLSLDGILTSRLRKLRTSELLDGFGGGALLDGGLHTEHPIDWCLPLASCHMTAGDDWHWLCTTARVIDHQGRPLPAQPPDNHRIGTQLDLRRAHAIALKVPNTAGGSSGRFRPRLTPVLTTVAAGLEWRAVGDIERIQELLEPITSVGGRRGNGEGSVLSWNFHSETDEADPWMYAHHWGEGRLARPMPVPCAEQVPFAHYTVVTSGVRPPHMHPSRSRPLAVTPPTTR